MNPAALTTLPPELFPAIATFVPLRSAPHTLRALAHANRRFYNICHPILYSRLILRNEADAIGVIQRIMDDPQLGLLVAELYIMSELSAKARKRKRPLEVVSGLQMLVARGLIPRITALGLYLLKGWTDDEIFARGRLLEDFWINLRTECPRLRTLLLRNIGHSYYHPWLTGPVIDEINSLSNLSVLRLEWIQRGGPDDKDARQIMNNLPRLASSLHTLSLRGDFHCETTILFSLDFPHLKLLRLYDFEPPQDTEMIHGFFERHPQLESLSLEGRVGTWFSNNVEVGVLPNLKHLKARFEDIRFFIPILPQLVSLGFTESYNGQVPYLLRAVLRDGLPRLRSLDIKQDIMTWEKRTLEGVLWDETVDGQFQPVPNRKQMILQHRGIEGYLHSIARGAPNVEELALHGMDLTSAALKTLEPLLAMFAKLERFYYHYRGFAPDPKYGDAPHPWTDKKVFADFLASAEALARVCTRLESVTSISGKTLPYVAGAIERNSVGEVTAVKQVAGLGLLISADENDPFPCNA